MTAPRLLADDMLGRLARWLRGAGLDVAYAGAGEDDDKMLRRARREGRIVLTRDHLFPGGAKDRIVIEARDLDDQLVEVFRRLPGFDPLAAPFSRCMECNEPVVAEEDPRDGPGDVEGPYTRCPSCGRLFWVGSHVDRIRERLGATRKRAREAVAAEQAGEPPTFERREYDAFLQALFPMLGLSWRGYRRVRLGLRARIRRRMTERGDGTLGAYLVRVRGDREERRLLGAMLNVTISRFFRDRDAWLRLPWALFPELAALAAGGAVRAWSLGCASGEEPYTLRMMWDVEGPPETPLDLLAGDISEACLARALGGLYPESAVHSMPARYRSRFFRPDGGLFRLDIAVLRSVRFERFDWRSGEWPGPFHLVLARNGPFTYLDEGGRCALLERIAAALVPGGFLWIGGNERLPGVWDEAGPSLYRRGGDGRNGKERAE